MVDHRGTQQRVNAPVRPYAGARVSPDGTRVALAIRDQERDIWIWDLAREAMRKLTHGPATDDSPEWTPDGRHLVFASNRTGSMNLYMQAADGSGPVRRLTSSHTAPGPTAVGRDSILGHEFGAATSFDLFFSLEGSADTSRGASPAEPDASQVQPLVRDAAA